MENTITEKNSTGRLYPDFETFVRNQYDDPKIEFNSNKSRIVKRRKLRGRIKTFMNVNK